MKIAIICPIGDLNRFGYQRTAPICLDSWRAVGDLFVVQSSRNDPPFHIKATAIRSDETLMSLADEGRQEHFDHRLVANNANVGIKAAREAGYDIALTICANWYVEADNAAALKMRCQGIVGGGAAFGFLYRRWQMAATLFDADLKSPCIFNLRKVQSDPVLVLVDEAMINGMRVSRMRGMYQPLFHEAYIDVDYEVTEREFRDKLTDVRNYEDILPKREGMDWTFWQGYFRNRMQELKKSGDVLGEVGRHVYKARPAKAFSDSLLKELEAV